MTRPTEDEEILSRNEDEAERRRVRRTVHGVLAEHAERRTADAVSRAADRCGTVWAGLFRRLGE